jgi:hypothetical protein
MKDSSASSTTPESPDEYAQPSQPANRAPTPQTQGTDATAASSGLTVATALIVPVVLRIDVVSNPGKTDVARDTPATPHAGSDVATVILATAAPLAQTFFDGAGHTSVDSAPPARRANTPPSSRPASAEDLSSLADDSLASLVADDVRSLIVKQVDMIGAATLDEVLAFGASIERVLGALDDMTADLHPEDWIQGPVPWLLGIGSAAIALTLAQSAKLMRESEKDTRAIGWESTNWSGLPD